MKGSKQVLTYEMEVRRSRRLLGLTSEVDEFKDKCFICQGDLAIDSLTRCRAKSCCCGKFLHKRCFHQELQYSDKCGHCKTSSPCWDEDEEQLYLPRWCWKGFPTQQMPSIGIGYGVGLIIFTIVILFHGEPCRTMWISLSGLNFIQDSPASCSKGETRHYTSMPHPCPLSLGDHYSVKKTDGV